FLGTLVEEEDKEEEAMVLIPIIRFSNINSETFLSDSGFFSDDKTNTATRSFRLISDFSQLAG
ncbi:MAG: hypothetical protein ACJ71M_17750, partial [Nitrososphaeraceae archaeon]